MKRLLLILMLLILPFQFSWAAAGAYCQHEEGRAAQHFGHHGHLHQAKADDPDGSSSKVHNDCSSCHLIGQAAIFATFAMVILPPGSTHIEPALLFYYSHIPDGPKRPDWRSVA